MILIYADSGVSQDCILALQDYFKDKAKLVFAEDIIKTDWLDLDSTQLLIMPGGKSKPFYEKLGNTGNQNIINFVKSGGNYLGLCAGAYYASAQTIFAKNLPLEIILSGELNFFPGEAIGPVFNPEKFAYQSEAGADILTIQFGSEQYCIYNNGGCYFKDPENFSNISVLATYENNLAAIIECKVGKGKAILCGAHPELSLGENKEKCMQKLLFDLL